MSSIWICFLQLSPHWKDSEPWFGQTWKSLSKIVCFVSELVKISRMVMQKSFLNAVIFSFICLQNWFDPSSEWMWICLTYVFSLGSFYLMGMSPLPEHVLGRVGGLFALNTETINLCNPYLLFNEGNVILISKNLMYNYKCMCTKYKQ